MSDSLHILEIRNVRVSCANAMNGQIASGFPAVSAFLGFTEALERKMTQRAIREYQEEGAEFKKQVFFEGVAIICSDNTPQVYGSGVLNLAQRGRSEHAFGEQQKAKGMPAIVRESYTNMVVTLLIGVRGLSQDEGDVRFIRDEPATEGFIQAVRDAVPYMRMAGGTIETLGDVRLHNEADPIIPPWGYALVSAHNTLQERVKAIQADNAERAEDDQRDIMDALYSVCLHPVSPRDSEIRQKQEKLFGKPNKRDSETAARLSQEVKANEPLRKEFEASLQANKKVSGLGVIDPKQNLVVMQTGYAVLQSCPAGSVLNSRDKTTPFLFVEPLHGLNRWVPISVLKNGKSASSLFWTYAYPHARLSETTASDMPRAGDVILFKNSYEEAQNNG